MTMTWIYLGIAIVSEVIATSFLKLSDGFTKLWPSVVVVIGYGLAFFFLSLTLRSMSIGVAYAVWSGVGTAVVAVIGVAVFQESVSAAKIVCILLIVAGVVGLQLSSRPPTERGAAWEKAEL